MKQSEQVIGRLARKLHECLAQEGIEAELEVSDHEGTVAARKELEGKTVRVIVHVSDRELLPSAHGSLPREEAKARLLTAAVRPTLEQRSASGAEPQLAQRPGGKPSQEAE